MKDPDKQETGIFLLVLIAMCAGILVGFYLASARLPESGAASAFTRNEDRP